ncbi:hypothetical protein [Streptomyces sp. NPDC006274]|uniref:hypothetical protein n=1 Tax=unclassified Streptomyces TaxID=2593676 RepID=UPI0033BEDBA6
MLESTDTTTAQEALRRVQDLDPGTRALLIQIADRLTSVRPAGLITDSRRLTLALRYATTTYGFRTEDANDAEQKLLRHMPPIEAGITRGEYALRLRKAASR